MYSCSESHGHLASSNLTLELQSFKRCTRRPCPHRRACRRHRSGRTPAPQCLHGASRSPVSSSVTVAPSREVAGQAASRISALTVSSRRDVGGHGQLRVGPVTIFPEPFGPRELVVGNVGSQNLPIAWGVLKHLFTLSTVR